MNLVNRNIFLAKIFILLSLSIVESVAPQAHGAGDISLYIQTFKQLGYTNVQILSEFKKAIRMVDHNNSNVALALENNNESNEHNDEDKDNRIFWSTVSLSGVVILAAGSCLVYYLLKEDATPIIPANREILDFAQQQPKARIIFAGRGIQPETDNAERGFLYASPEMIRLVTEAFSIDPITGQMTPIDPITGEIIPTIIR